MLYYSRGSFLHRKCRGKHPARDLCESWVGILILLIPITDVVSFVFSVRWFNGIRFLSFFLNVLNGRKYIVHNSEMRSFIFDEEKVLFNWEIQLSDFEISRQKIMGIQDTPPMPPLPRNKPLIRPH